MSSWLVALEIIKSSRHVALKIIKSSWHVASEIMKSSWHVALEIITSSWHVALEIMKSSWHVALEIIKSSWHVALEISKSRDHARLEKSSVEFGSICARSGELMVPGDFLSSLLTLCYCVLHVLKHFVHWNWCIASICSTVACCNSSALCTSVSADRIGMAASRFLVLQLRVLNRIVMAA